MSTSIKARGLVTALVALAAIGAALLALFVLGSPAVAGSTDLQVTKTADTNDGACNSDCSLREAIIRSNTSGADAIELPAGTYKLTLKNPTGNPDENFAATGDLDVRRGVTIRSEEGARKTIINGNGIDRVFHTPFQNTSTPFTLAIFGVKITGGVSDFGGGIFHDAQGATLHLGRSTVSGNQSVVGGNGGGGIVAQRGPLTIVESTISGNKAPGSQGGGIYISGPGPNTITNTTISGNQSRFGGGIETYEPVRITDSTIASNTAQQPGGGLHVGGGDGPYTLKNTIISNNKSDFAAKNCEGRPDFVVSEGNNLEKGTSCGLDDPTDINAGPRLGDLANNGGPTNTRALLAGSPAIDTGGDPFPPTDQRGVARPQGFANDIGAFEKKQGINVVVCPTGGSDYDCVGTSGRDALVGRDNGIDNIQGGEGDDIYNGKGSCDSLWDTSLASTDRYLVTVKNFCNNGISSLSVRDDGGNSDVLDLSRFYASTDFVFDIGFTNLIMDEPGSVNDIDVLNFFTPNGGPTDSIETFKFSDKTLTAQQVRAMVE